MLPIEIISEIHSYIGYDTISIILAFDPELLRDVRRLAAYDLFIGTMIGDEKLEREIVGIIKPTRYAALFLSRLKTIGGIKAAISIVTSPTLVLGLLTNRSLSLGDIEELDKRFPAMTWSVISTSGRFPELENEIMCYNYRHLFFAEDGHIRLIKKWKGLFIAAINHGRKNGAWFIDINMIDDSVTLNNMMHDRSDPPARLWDEWQR